MRRIFLVIISLICSTLMFGANINTQKSQAYKEWHEGKYSMFIHFGLYSELGGVWQNERVTRGYSEQIQSQGGIFSDSYEAVAGRFNPSKFNASEIVALAKEAGMRSIVFTSKHHDGFCMFKTATTEFNSWDSTPVARDFVAELSKACAEEGLRFGLYFSLIDWHYPYAYPISSSNADPITPEHHQFNKAQVSELLSNYGAISELWFDMGSLTPEQSTELYELVHRLQPDCMVSGRLGNDQYDFCVMGDNAFPDGTLKTSWQTPASMFSETWGYRSWQERGAVEDKVAEKLRALLGVASHGGNYLLNIGPKGDGSVVDFEAEVLKEVGKWLAVNGVAVYATEPFALNDSNLSDKIYTTKKGNNIYLLPVNTPETQVAISLNGAKLIKGYFLDNGEAVKTYTKNGAIYVSVPATGAKDNVRPIALSFNKPIEPEVANVINAKGKSLLLNSANAIQDNSYSCFDYYTNYKSIIGYNWNFTGKGATELEISYTKEYEGRKITLEIDGEIYEVALENGVSKPLTEEQGRNGEWSPTYYAIQRGSFSRNIPNRVYELPNKGFQQVTEQFMQKPGLNTSTLIVRDVVVEEDCEMMIEFASGNGVEVLVNGESVLKHLNNYKEENRHELLKISLQKGRNQILVGAYNKWAKQVPLFLEPVENVIYTIKLPLNKAISRSGVHSIRLGAEQGANPHTDIQLSNVDILIK